ncbi:RNA-dependent RNA polymerase [Mycena venus]|uniref:RNA-dependent RNA polymerase n=1 Tax=Mycena venus TaxID=2733690 RepID=A0A8H7DBN3_9AGAR|nr:RNA-dependent RNA polymerase [Mycena venus]
MGSMQGPIFRQGFRIEVDHSSVSLNFQEQSLFFRICFDNAPFELPALRARCPIDDMQSVQLVKHGRGQATLTVTLRRPPLIEADFRRVSSAHEGLEIRRATELDWSPEEVEEATSGAPATMPCGFRTHTPMKFGLWLTYRFEFSGARASELERVTTSLSRLRKLSLERPGTEEIMVDSDANSTDTVIGSTAGTDQYIGTELEPLDQWLEDARYPFDARYLLSGLVSQGLLLALEVPDIIHHLWPVHPATRLFALRGLFRLERRALVGPLALKELRNLTQHPPPHSRIEQALPADRVSMRRVVVTPTRVLLFPELIETGNRVLRAWKAQMDAGLFIRVGFADEDGRLRVTKKITEADNIDPSGGILARIENVLKNGLCVAGRYYVFLAAGESQLKDHSCWMVCEDGDFTADRVRAQMGDFSAERVVAKYAARMGLCFSATRHVVTLAKSDVESLDDIKHGDYVYTDGVGNCSQELATLCGMTLGSEQAAPSAVQIRMGGIKGVLSFASSLLDLGVMKAARYGPAHLNRQAICIMEALGVNVQALTRLFENQIARAKNLELELKSLDTSRHPAKHVYRNAFIPIKELVRKGLGEQALVRNVLACIKCQLLKDLKYRARVLVHQGAYLMGTGIADEWEVLKEGEIYCAITPSGSNSRQVITGQCTIFRSPCIHPGDMRLVTAVEHPAFQEAPLTNVIVFSVKGANRNLPSKCVSKIINLHRGFTFPQAWRAGGGDLDGDYYTVIYDKELQITREHEPMDYTPVEPLKKDRVDINDICDFVVDFIKSDAIGIVASYFQALADQLGPEHPLCLELAKAQFRCGGFSKKWDTRVYSEQVRRPQNERNIIRSTDEEPIIFFSLRPEMYPDFMDKDPDFTYRSPRILGRMYRLIEPAPQYQPISDVYVDARLVSVKVPPAYLKMAGQLKHNYDVELEGIMRQHRLCEAEIIAGVSVMNEQKRRRAADDAIRGPVREAMDAVKGKYRRLGRFFVKDNPSARGLETWAIACYQVTHVEAHRVRWVDALNHSRRGSAAVSDAGSDDEEYGEVQRRDLLSFPWLWSHGSSLMLNRVYVNSPIEICHWLDDTVIKEEEEEVEDLEYPRKNWGEDNSHSDDE